MRRLVLLPILLFSALAILFFIRLSAGDASRIPSALIGRAAPSFALPALDGASVPAPSPDALTGQVSVVNVWASWCGPCRIEHPHLMAIGRDPRIRLIGLNHKDRPSDALAFLQRYGNPFAAIASDSSGRASIEWGVYGVPETFIVGRDGRIAYKHVGPISAQSLEAAIRPEIEKALARP